MYPGDLPDNEPTKRELLADEMAHLERTAREAEEAKVTFEEAYRVQCDKVRELEEKLAEAKKDSERLDTANAQEVSLYFCNGKWATRCDENIFDGPHATIRDAIDHFTDVISKIDNAKDAK